MIGIIDYGMGNLRSVQKAFEFIGQDAIITNNLVKLNDCSHLVLPGVGAYQDAMQSLNDSGMSESLFAAHKSGKPVLGICLGMQMLFDSSSEGIENNNNTVVKGLSMLAGDVVKFDIDLKVPHIGWNKVEPIINSRLYDGVTDKYFYFVHSFYLPLTVKSANAMTEYALNFAPSVESGNLFGVQFHPEKSGNTGLKLLDNFAKITS